MTVNASKAMIRETKTDPNQIAANNLHGVVDVYIVISIAGVAKNYC